jgi:predicted RNA-binding Zn-ribbon protein involved in translation (DUF1610 family)
MAIRHTPQPLKGKNHLFWIWGVALGLVTVGLMFGSFRLAQWIGMKGAGILAAAIFISAIFIHDRIKHRIASSLEAAPCPQCGKKRMHFKEGPRDDNHAYLVCPDCGTKWDIGSI